jgi:hypothetical protein
MTQLQLDNHLAYLNRDFHEGFPFQEKDVFEMECFKEKSGEIIPFLKTNIALVEGEEVTAIVVNLDFYFQLLRAWSFVDDLKIAEMLEGRIAHNTPLKCLN